MRVCVHVDHSLARRIHEQLDAREAWTDGDVYGVDPSDVRTLEQRVLFGMDGHALLESGPAGKVLSLARRAVAVSLSRPIISGGQDVVVLIDQHRSDLSGQTCGPEGCDLSHDDEVAIVI